MSGDDSDVGRRILESGVDYFEQYTVFDGEFVHQVLERQPGDDEPAPDDPRWVTVSHAESEPLPDEGTDADDEPLAPDLERVLALRQWQVFFDVNRDPHLIDMMEGVEDKISALLEGSGIKDIRDPVGWLRSREGMRALERWFNELLAKHRDKGDGSVEADAAKEARWREIEDRMQRRQEEMMADLMEQITEKLPASTPENGDAATPESEPVVGVTVSQIMRASGRSKSAVQEWQQKQDWPKVIYSGRPKAYPLDAVIAFLNKRGIEHAFKKNDG